MKFKQTLFFAIFVAGVVGYTVYDYSKIKYIDESKRELVKLFPYKSYEELKEFKITNKEKIIFLKKTGVVWQLIAPIEYPGDQDYINSALALLDQPLETLGELDDQSIFSDATVNIGFKFNGGDYKDILVSNKKTSDGRIYIQDINTKKIYATNADWLSVSRKSIFDFRWKYLFVLKENIKRVSFVKNMNQSYYLNYNPVKKNWQNPHHEQLIFSDKKMAQFLSDLMAIKVYKFVSEIKTEDILANYSLSKPAMKIEFTFENEQIPNWGLNISKKHNDTYYATFINRAQVFELQKDDVNKLKTYLNELN